MCSIDLEEGNVIFLEKYQKGPVPDTQSIISIVVRFFTPFLCNSAHFRF